MAVLLIVDLGKRPSAEFQWSVKTLKSYGFRWNPVAQRWQRYIEEEHAERLTKELLLLGIRATQDKVSH